MADVLVRGSYENPLFYVKCLSCRNWIRWRKSEGSAAIDPKTRARLSVMKCPSRGCKAKLQSEV